jgi:hypothetical protein
MPQYGRFEPPPGQNRQRTITVPANRKSGDLPAWVGNQTDLGVAIITAKQCMIVDPFPSNAAHCMIIPFARAPILPEAMRALSPGKDPGR